MTNIAIPEFCLVVLIGASGSGKSTFAKHHFAPTEIISSDACRALVSDDENDQTATKDAFDVLQTIARKRLARMKLTVIDATNVQQDARQHLVKLANTHYAAPIAIVLDMPKSVCIERNKSRENRKFGVHVIQNQQQHLRRSINGLEREGFKRVFIFSSPEELENLTITRHPLYPNRKHDAGPFDIIGDVHGCYDELVALLRKLGYVVDAEAHQASHPDGRKVVFVGDLVDRGPKSVDVLRLAMNMVKAETALCVAGNHDEKLARKLRKRDNNKMKIGENLAKTLAQLDAEPPDFKPEVSAFLDELVSHYVLDDGALVVAHAGIKEEMIGRATGDVRSFTLYGDVTGEKDDDGFPIRRDWAIHYRGSAMIVYGHVAIGTPEWVNNTLNLDTGCAFGRMLSALRYPEKEVVQVDALAEYSPPNRPFWLDTPQELTIQQGLDDQLTITDVMILDDPMGKRFIETRLDGKVQIRQKNATAALEVMSRYAVNPKWLVYLPPTMSPVNTSDKPDLLEHPTQAFSYYQDMGVDTVICQEKHMGSRAVVVICKDESVAQSRFGIIGEGRGMIYTRTGRHFFEDDRLEIGLLDHLADAITHAGLWDDLKTDWIVLDCELMPWSAKALALLQDQYAAVGSSAQGALKAVIKTLGEASPNYPEIAPLLARYERRAENIQQFIQAYRHYCWDVVGLADLRLAPFHLLATEGAVHTDKTHLWHMEILAKLQIAGDNRIFPTQYQVVNLKDDTQIQAGVAWWESLTEKGGEGMVVKPMEFVMMGKRGIIQPALKVRGREYLRIIYGAEYVDHLDLLRERAIGHKRNLALREFALGIEALERFVAREPLRRVHECVFGILALESEPIDPRL